MIDEISGQDLPYTNRELREKWHDISNQLHNIVLQTTKTNGSVSEINRWRERVNGGALVASVFMTVIVVPILCWAVYVLVNIQEIVHRSVDEALSAYELQVK